MKIFKKIFQILIIIILIILIVMYFIKKQYKSPEIIVKVDDIEEIDNKEIKYDSRYIRKINEINILNNEIKNKYKFVFISDLHMSIDDENEDDEKIKNLLKKRNSDFYGDTDFVTVQNTFKEIIDYSNNLEANALLLGGDIVDSPADSSIKVLRENLNNLKIDYLYTLGNHDWTYLWDYQSEETKKENIPKFEEFMDDVNVSYLEYDDLIILSINSSSSKIEEADLPKIKEVLNKQKPTIVMMHVPIATPKIEDFSKTYRDRFSTIGDIEIDESNSILENEEEKATKEAIDMILSDKYKVFYIISGHIHLRVEDDLNERIHEFVTEAAYFGNINVIEIN